MNNIKTNIDDIRKKIENAAQKSGRDIKNITLLGVTKTIDIERISESLKYGITEIGENKVQEIRTKYDYFKNKVKFHMIGHLQRNKVKYIIDKVDLIHSVDSIRLAEKINEEARKINKVIPILIQVNIANEDTKFGISPKELNALLNEISLFEYIKVKGLMTIAPYVENSEENRKYFKQMYKLFVDIKAKNINNIDMSILSMGMTNDYTIAIEEGSTLVRIGTGIFGKRNYNN